MSYLLYIIEVLKEFKSVIILLISVLFSLNRRVGAKRLKITDGTLSLPSLEMRFVKRPCFPK